jgi:hypothetical protein
MSSNRRFAQLPDELLLRSGVCYFFVLAKDAIANFYSIYYPSISREPFYILISQRLIGIMQTGGKGFGDSTSWGSPFFGSVVKGLCNNNGKDKPQDCTMLAGRVGVMWADGSGRIADPSTGIT